MSEPFVMGIDPSLTATGAVYLRSGSFTQPEILVPTTKDFTRVIELSDSLTHSLEEFGKRCGLPDLAVIEGYGFAGKKLGALTEVGTAYRLALVELGIPFRVAAPAQIKKFATGRGVGVDKAIISREVYKRWSFEHDSNDVVDAYVAARIGLALMNEGGPLDAPQTEVIGAIRAKARRGQNGYPKETT